MNYDYYRIFYYVGKHKNITRAAAELYSSQPALTRAIQNLESELNCRLFVRTKNGVEFTNEGQRLFEYVNVAHNQLLKGEEEISRAVSVDGGTIHIGSSVTALHNFLFNVLDDFHYMHPGVKFKITTGSNNGTVEKLKTGLIDLAFVSTPFNNSKELTTVTVASFNDILIAGNSFGYLKDKRLSLTDIKNYPFICLRQGMQLRQFIDDIFIKNGLTVSPDIETDGADLLVSMICHNFGLGFVPQGMAEDAIERGEVFRIELDEELPERSICMVSDPHHPHTNASREFYKIVKNRIRS
ncbi:MAG: LysR family transcriptional regulator [Clostridiales bacterium]|nr:LysR family transcriptional regulator [Clostridiales bacterium]